MTQQLECLRCHTRMQDGYVVDSSESGFRQQIWHPGSPVRSFWVGLKMDKHRCLPVTTLRCPNCGYLESYAKNPA
jgi:hypothetical protein